MHVIKVRNVNEALPEGLRHLEVFGERRASRAGDVVVSPGPVTTVYGQPLERVLFDAERDANPFFHFFEGLWMLAGRNDVASVAHYVKRMGTFSDDGETLHGAYGHRWRLHFGFDQLGVIIEALKKNPEDRRNVLQMWDASVDLGRDGKDVPCNTQAYFTRQPDGQLDMMVCCRSNDIIMGAYGANVVHFSMLHEYMAGAIGCPVGVYRQMSNNYHAYTRDLEPLAHLADNVVDPHRRAMPGLYADGTIEPYPMMDQPVQEWQQDLQMLLEEGVVIGLRSRFLRRVAAPIINAHQAYKTMTGQQRYLAAKEIMAQCLATDWRFACTQWLSRRENRWIQAQDDGPVHEQRGE